jgi:hypothetical protein
MGPEVTCSSFSPPPDTAEPGTSECYCASPLVCMCVSPQVMSYGSGSGESYMSDATLAFLEDTSAFR